MNLEEIVILLPCYSLEDLSLDRGPDEADQLLAAWTGPFHPTLLQRAGSIPKWTRADDPPQDLNGRIVVVPGPAETLLPAGWLDSAGAVNPQVIRGFRNRQHLVQTALNCLGEALPAIDAGLVADFFALGFCHFQVELLTRQLRYMSNLDEAGFIREALAAAEAATQGDDETARQRLRGGFDLLTEAREYFYPVETYLLDLTVVATTTIGPSLRKELASPHHVNLLATGGTIERMAREAPATLAALRTRLEAEQLTLIGGELGEPELPLLPLEDILAGLRRGAEAYQRHLGRRPELFGRRRFGLTPVLPQILKKLAFRGVVHSTLDAGRFPAGNQSKVRWEGVDGTTIEALVRVPLDGADAATYLRLPEKLGDTMDLDHAATAVFAHWPGLNSPWYEDLRRMVAYSPVLGRFVSAHQYFQHTEYVGQTTRYGADQYRSPYLRQAVHQGRPDPVSRWVRYLRSRAEKDARQALATAAALTGPGPPPNTEPPESGVTTHSPTLQDTSRLTSERDLPASITAMARDMARRLAGSKAGGTPGYLVLNPWSFPCRLVVDVSGLTDLPAPGRDGVRRVDRASGTQAALVDVPGMGYTWIGSGPPAPAAPPAARTRRRKRAKPEPPLAEEHRLRNEFFEATVNPQTGAIQAIHAYTSRGSRLTQQIAFRSHRDRTGEGSPEGDEDAYSIMAADEVSITRVDGLVGEITARGRLVDRQGRRVAGFMQTARVQRGSRVLELEIELDVDRCPGPDPWSSYYAARFAWGDATADLYRSVNQTSQPTDAAQVESPYYIDIRGEKTRTTLLTGGLPYHRRFGLRKLDTLLAVSGETARSFRLGVGIDLRHPMPAAMQLIAPPIVLPHANRPQPRPTGWFFHLGSRSVLATAWECQYDGSRLAGVRVRLLETEGRRVATRLQTCYPVSRAVKMDFLDQPLAELEVEGEVIRIELGPYEWAQVHADFAQGGRSADGRQDP